MKHIFESITIHQGHNLIVNGLINNTRRFRARITQSSTNAPTAIVYENSLGGTPVFSRAIAGSYTMTLAGAFPTGRTSVLITSMTANRYFQFSNANANTIGLACYNATTNALTDDTVFVIDITVNPTYTEI